MQNDNEDKFEKYLLEDLILLYACYANTFGNEIIPVFESYKLPTIFESENIFQNYEFIIGKITSEILKKSKNFSDENKIDIEFKLVQQYPKKINVTLYHSNGNYVRGYFTELNDNIVYLDIELFEDASKYYVNELKAIILHELLHGYEEFIRQNKNLPSIFDELKNDSSYKRAVNNLNFPRKDLELMSEKDKEWWMCIKNISIAKYFYNEHEIFAYMGTLEYKLKNILKRIKPNYTKIKYNDIVKELKNEYVWKNYLDFGKFILYINNIEDDILEDAYTYICEQKDKAIEFTKEQFKIKKELLSKGLEYKMQKYKEKSANEIRKECKDVWFRFKSEFDIGFVKIYNKFIQENDKRIF